MDQSQLKTAYEVKSMGALVTSHSVRKNDDGLIIIGGSMMHKIHNKLDLQKAVKQLVYFCCSTIFN